MLKQEKIKSGKSVFSTSLKFHKLLNNKIQSKANAIQEGKKSKAKQKKKNEPYKRRTPSTNTI